MKILLLVFIGGIIIDLTLEKIKFFVSFKL